MTSPAPATPAAMLATLQARTRQAHTLPELAFSIANDPYALLAYRQALVFAGPDDGDRLMAVSGLARPTEDSPYLVWLRRSWPWLREQVSAKPGWYELPSDDTVPADVRDGWAECWPRGLLALPLRNRKGETLGWACFLLDAPPTTMQASVLNQVCPAWGYSWEMLTAHTRKRWKGGRLRHLGLTRTRVVLALALLALLIPVRQTVLAPAEVVALDAAAVAAPIDGVVRTIHVRPNQTVKAGDPLFSLDDTTLRNRLEVAQVSVAVADAELISATQKAFDNVQSRGELALLSGRAHERRAELAAVQAQLARIEVVAPADGVAVFGDPDDWLGRPVSTGERILLLANPDSPGALLHLPVADAIALDPGAQIKLFLTVKPLSPLSAHITETSYQSVLSPEGIASYRLRAEFDDTDEQIRIGLRGTAKIYGDWASLGYYLFRRPFATLREWTGL